MIGAAEEEAGETARAAAGEAAAAHAEAEAGEEGWPGPGARGEAAAFWPDGAPKPADRPASPHPQ